MVDYVVSDGTGPRHLSQLPDLLAECADFALATETVTGRDLSVRLRGLMVQTDVLDRQLRHVLIAFQDTIAVLPPHRTPQPRHLIPPPAVRSTPPPRLPRPPRPASRAASDSSTRPRASLGHLPESLRPPCSWPNAPSPHRP
ncbi:hypothetical protein [Streptomyces sp. NPDC056399]|uniref:hypothetical protein n=1 Tax=Streptomyces sp. NPDC056399 TaxID=3345807 RepID=UPI0035D55595